MTDRVLTDDEIEGIIDALNCSSRISSSLDKGRAVEAAVLAKRPKPVYEMLASDWSGENVRRLEDAGYVVVMVHDDKRAIPISFSTSDATVGTTWKFTPEREARKRERAAVLNYIKKRTLIGESSSEVKDFLATYYPLPTKTRPRTTVLSTGLKVEKRAEGWVAYDAVSSAHYGIRIPFSLCKTPDDARKLADLVEHPTEEVPDDE